MDNEFVYLVDKDISNLRERIENLERKVLDMRTIAVELAISVGWGNESIINVIGSNDKEINFFRGE